MLESRELLRHLEELGVQLYADGQRLRLNAPRGVVTPALQTAIAERKLELLSLVHEKSAASMDLPFQQVSREQPQLLSISQERLWGLMQMAGDTPIYNMYQAFRLVGELDQEALTSSLAYLIQRHEPLRTQFAIADGQPVQHVREFDGWSPVFLDLSSDAQLEAHLNEHLQREAAYPFNPLSEPLFRASLLRLSEAEHILVLVMHHLISDGWSWDVFLRELAALYAACHRDGFADLPNLPIQYVDFTSWQRHFVETPRFAAQKEYWFQTLRGVPPLELPLDTARTPSLDFAGARAELVLSPGLAARVHALSMAENVTSFMMLLAVFEAVLHRITGQQDLLIGTPVSGRGHTELQTILGYFNNILPLRIAVSGEESFRDLLARVRGVALAAYENADVPLHCLTDHPELSQVPFSRAVFALQDGTGNTLSLDGLQVEQLPIYNNTANFDLFFTVHFKADAVHLVTEYRNGLFRPETIQNLLNDFAIFLDAPLVEPGASLADLLPAPGTVMKTIDSLFPEQRYVAPRTPLEIQLVALWEEMFSRQPIGVNDNFFDIGGHSLLALRLFTRIERETGTNLPLSMLFETLTVARLAKLIEGESRGSSWNVLVPIQPNGSKPPFFCVHGIGGGVIGYRDVMNAMADDDLPFYGLQAVGQDGREAYDATIEAMASRYIDAMRARQPHGPYRIGGYCFGGVVAYEMACQLEKVGEQVSVLAIFEGAMPGDEDNHVPFSQRWGIFWKNLSTWIGDYSSMSPVQIFNRIGSTFTRISSKFRRDHDLERKMRVEDTLGIDIDHFSNTSIELTEVHSNAAQSYVPDEYSGAVTLFRARNRSINEVVFGSLDPKMGWDRLAKGGVDVHLVDGFHRNMHLAPYVISTAAALKKCLDEDNRNEQPGGA
jgi:thioesterase domain-containing protein/acyl carrier protein